MTTTTTTTPTQTKNQKIARKIGLKAGDLAGLRAAAMPTTVEQARQAIIEGREIAMVTGSALNPSKRPYRMFNYPSAILGDAFTEGLERRAAEVLGHALRNLALPTLAERAVIEADRQERLSRAIFEHCRNNPPPHVVSN